MTEIRVERDDANATLTLTSSWAVTPERLWGIWADPRLLERWWGPPTHPATVTEHDLTAGGRVAYFMTGPDGADFHGAWRVEQVSAPRHLRVIDEFVDEHGAVMDDLPATSMDVRISGDAVSSTMELVSTFADAAAMEQVIGMGAIEGMRAAMSQIDAVLAD
jgi:uncharacterized protein YndB with AHSA1/START domain